MGMTTQEQATLLGLVEPGRWQRLQDHFSGVLGIALRTFNLSRDMLVNPSWPPGAPADHMVAALQVGEEVEQLLPDKDLPRNCVSVTTAFGVTYSAVPIRATPEQILGYFIAGPMVAGPREDRVQFRQRVQGSGVDAQAVWSIILSLKPHTYSNIRSLLNLLEEVGSSLVQFAYQASHLTAILPPTYTANQAIASYYTDRILNSLLDVATLATGAEGGSVMMREPQEDLLRIRASHGLSESVVVGTRQRRDEGLAGIATRQRSVVLIDDQVHDPFVTRLMRRQHLASSLIAPITLEPDQEPVGVLSLRTSNGSRRFTQGHADMLHRLLELTSIALGNLRAAFTKPRTS